MPLIPLLSKENAPLHRLSLARILLDVDEPQVSLDTQGDELALVSLVGQASVAVDGLQAGMVGGRRRVTEARVEVFRMPEGSQASLTIQGTSHAADLLVARCAPTQARPAWPVQTWQWHRHDTVFHEVGDGCYRRTVAEVPTPIGYEIHCGQTMSDGVNGCWSSWPSHCAPEETARYVDHEEVFFCLTSGHFLMRMDGIYCTGERAQGLREIGNGDTLVTPLGSHELTTTPGDVGVYIWFYRSFLKKQYNKYSHESIKKVYVK